MVFRYVLLCWSVCSVTILFGQPKKVIKLYEKGQKQMDSRKYVGAVVSFTDAIAIGQDYGPAYNQRGNAFFNLGKYEMAIKDYVKSIELDPAEIMAYINGIEAAKLGKLFEEGLSITHSLEKNFSDNVAQAYMYRGIFHIDLEQYKLAQNCLLVAQDKMSDEFPENLKIIKDKLQELEKKLN